MLELAAITQPNVTLFERTPARSAGLLDLSDKLASGERLTLADGVRLFETPDLLALGWLANRERERRHAGTDLLQLQHPHRGHERLRGHVPVLFVLPAAARRSRVVHAVAGAGLGQAAPACPPAADRGPRRQRPASGPAVFDYYTDLLPGFKRIRPEIHLKCFTAVEIAFFSDLYGDDRRAGAARADGRRPRLAARRRRRGVLRARAPQDLPRQGRRRSLAQHPSHGAPAWACARTSRCSTGTSRPSKSASITCCGRVRCRTRPAASRRSSRWRFIPTTTRCGSCRRPRPTTRCACTPSRG